MKNDQSGLIEVLYFKCQESILLGKLPDAKMYFSLLADSYQEENKEAFFDIISEERMKELQLIKRQIESNKLIEEYESFTPLENDIEMTETEIEAEFDIVKKVCKNISVLEPFLGKNMQVLGIEHPTGKKDQCDLVSQDKNRTLYPIEFKLNKATHAVIGQIGKYCLHFKLGLIHKLYDRVQGVVIANSYSQYAINELMKRNYICLMHSGNLENIKFSKI